MVKSIQSVLWCWAASLLLLTLTAIVVSYFLTGYQAKHLNHTLQNQHKKLQQIVPKVPEQVTTTLHKQPPADMIYLLTQAAKQQQVDLHYQQSSERSEQWLVGISGTYQNAIRFIASILQTQYDSLQAFPFTQTLKWQDNDPHSGKLTWQVLWLTPEDSPPLYLNAAPLLKTAFPPILAEPIKCLSKPHIESNIQVSDWSVMQLLATQTSPIKKALLNIPGEPVLTLTENNWIATPLMQLEKVGRNSVTFQHWHKEAGCWSAKGLKLSLTKDNNPQ